MELCIYALTYLLMEVPPGCCSQRQEPSLCVSSTWHIVGVGSYLRDEGPRAEVEQGLEVKRDDEVKVEVVGDSR